MIFRRKQVNNKKKYLLNKLKFFLNIENLNQETQNLYRGAGSVRNKYRMKNLKVIIYLFIFSF